MSKTPCSTAFNSCSTLSQVFANPREGSPSPHRDDTVRDALLKRYASVTPALRKRFAPRLEANTTWVASIAGKRLLGDGRNGVHLDPTLAGVGEEIGRQKLLEQLAFPMINPENVCPNCYAVWKCGKPRDPFLFCHHFGTIAVLRPDDSWRTIEADKSDALALRLQLLRTLPQ